MRKKLILFLMLALFGSANFLRADVIEIGDGTATTYMVPFNSLYGYSFTEQVFLASEIGMAGDITSISFQIGQAYTSAQTNQYTVWMKNVARETFASNTDYEPVTAGDVVFQGEWEIPVCAEGDWITLTLDTPFAYDGTSNLMFAMHESTSGYSTRYFKYTTVTSSGISYYSDSYNPDPYNLSSYSGSKYVRDNRNNVQIDITPSSGVGGVAAQLTVHDVAAPSTNSYVPVYGFYADAYLKCEMVYPAAELTDMAGGTINGITFYTASPASEAWTGTWQVFVTEVTDPTISAFAGSGTVVYEGVLDGTGAEMTINFTTPYTYGGGNLLLGIYETATGNYKSVSWTGESVTGASVQGYSYSDLGSISPTQRDFLPKTTFDYVSAPIAWAPDYNAAMGDIVLVNPEVGQQNLTDPLTLRWTNAENAQYYYVEFGTVYGNLDLLVYGEEVEGWNGSLKLSDYDITIEPNTRYFWRVYNENNVDWVESELGVFTGEFNKPNHVKVIPEEIFTDGSTLVKWNILGGGISELPETEIGSGTGTTTYLPTYNFYNYSLTQQLFSVDEIGNAGIINSITFKPQGSITRNLQVYMVNTDKASFSGSTDWITVTNDDLVYSGNVAMAAPETTITLEEPFTFEGDHLAIIVNDLTGTYTSSISYAAFSATSQAIYIYQDGAAYNPLAPTSYSGTVANVKNQIIINKDRAGNRDLVGCNVYVDSVLMNTDGPITERQYTLTGQHMTDLGVTAYNMEGHSVCVTGVFEYGESNFSEPAILYVSGYGDVHGVVKGLMNNTGMADVTVTFTGKDEFNNTVTYEATTADNGTYAIDSIKAGTYDVTATYEDYAPAVIEGVVLPYNVDTEVDILYLHENYNPVYKVYAEEGEVLGAQVADVIWSFGNFDDPTPGNGGGNGGGGGGGGTTAGTFTEDFEGGLNGWTVLTINAGEGEWIHSSNNLGGYDYTTLAHGGTGFAMCYSYVDYVGAYNTDSYLITPQKYGIVAGSTLNFFADNANDSYPENFSVCVSTAATPSSAADFTTVWSGGAKGQGGREMNRHIENRYENWREHTIDLSAYAGQEVWIAFHDVNYDMYEIWIDDVELTAGAKSGNATADECGVHTVSTGSRDMWDLMMTFEAPEGGHYGVAYDGTNFYTSNWGYSSAAYNFYQYDLDGNMLEGFNISGCGTLRGMTYDGEYFYGVANSSTVYCVDLANHSVVSTFTSAYGAMRGITYDPARDGFWVIGNWSGNLTLIDRTGAVQFAGPEPTSASDLAYYKDDEGVEHVYCFNNGTNDVDDYNIATNTITNAVFNFNGTPGFASGSSGGCTVGDFQGKAAFIGDIQQSPNLIAIYELGEAQGGAPVVSGGSNLATNDHYFQIWRRPMLKENMPTDPAEIEALAIQIDESDHSLGFNDSVYTDLSYMSLEPGVYEYGIAAVYPWVDRSDFNVTGIVWSNDLDHNMTGNLTINGTCALGLDQIAGAVVTLTNNNEDYTYEAELSEEGTWSTEEFRKGDYTMTVNLPGYRAIVAMGDTTVVYVDVPADGLVMNLWNTEEINIEFVEDYAPVTWFTVSSTGFARWSDMLPQDRVAQRYHVLCDEIFQGETENNYMFLNTDNLVEGETYTAAVAVIYETGMSDFVTADFTYMSCENVGTQVEDLEGTVDLADVTLTWAGGNGSGVVPPPPGGATTFTEGFESGLPTGWTVVDGNNDGWTWCLTSDIPSTWTYYTMTLDWYRTGTNAICSGSYINGVGALTPNEYLVTDQVNLAAGSTFSFWAAATDASYPADHFGVFVSDDATNWTSVQEWTLTGKKGGNDGGRASRDGNGAKLGSWYNYSVDLSAYAGQKYIAIRHFNCNDQYIMCVDDIELSAGSKDGFVLGTAGHGFGLANNSLSDDGNWYYYDNGVNEDAIGTGGGNFWWGIMLPAGTYEGTSVTKVAAYDYMAMTGTASIYQGGTTAPAGSALGTVNVTFTESNDFVEFTFAEPVTIDPSQNVWVVFYNGSGATYPAAVCSNTGDANGRWVSLDGTTWEDLAGYGLNYTFMVRAYIEQGGVTPPPTPGAVAVTPNAFNIFMDGELIGATTDTTFTYTCDDDLEHQYCVMYFDANYNVSCANCINITADPLGVGQYNVVSAIYPNPTNGNLYINTNANMKSISIINVLGQMVYNKATEGTETVIDMAQFGNGIYMVNIVTENGTSVNRIIVNK